MKVLFLSTVSPHDRNAWSGISFHMYAALAGQHELHWSGRPYFSMADRFKLRLASWWRTIRGAKYTDQNLLYSRALGNWAEEQLLSVVPDIILVGAGEPEVFAYLETSTPIIYIADSTFALKLDYYPWHSGLSARFVKEGHLVETLALQRASRSVFSSTWAASSAVADHHSDVRHISVIPFGPNLLRPPLPVPETSGEMLNLLFICSNWIRKGGDDVIAAFKILSDKMPCTLTILGQFPEERVNNVTYIPYLDKNKDEAEDEYMRIFSSSHFLLMPSKADCTPVTVSEAAAFGVPVIGYDTGGLSAVIRNGINGFCLPAHQGPLGVAAQIERLWLSKHEYQEMRKTARLFFERTLNWEAWVDKVNRLILELGNSCEIRY